MVSAPPNWKPMPPNKNSQLSLRYPTSTERSSSPAESSWRSNERPEPASIPRSPSLRLTPPRETLTFHECACVSSWGVRMALRQPASLGTNFRFKACSTADFRSKSRLNVRYPFASMRRLCLRFNVAQCRGVFPSFPVEKHSRICRFRDDGDASECRFQSNGEFGGRLWSDFDRFFQGSILGRFDQYDVLTRTDDVTSTALTVGLTIYAKGCIGWCEFKEKCPLAPEPVESRSTGVFWRHSLTSKGFRLITLVQGSSPE